jgi:hypothetical protein
LIISDIVDFCDKNYKPSEYKCADCKNICRGSCEKCLEKINYSREDKRVYNCENIVYFYMNKYVYKYSSEFEHLFKKVSKLGSLDQYNILSIGCGPSTELYGIVKYFMNAGNMPEINYRGVDFNNIWSPIQVQTASLIKKHTENRVKIKYDNDDAFDIVSKMKVMPNLVILNYVLSDMIAQKYDVVNFLQTLLEKIIVKMSADSFIVLNDANYGRNDQEPRYYFNYLLSILHNKEIKLKNYSYYFNNDNKTYTYAYGTQHRSNKTTDKVTDEIRTKYNPWEFCTSAQLVVYKVA